MRTLVLILVMLVAVSCSGNIMTEMNPIPEGAILVESRGDWVIFQIREECFLYRFGRNGGLIAPISCK